MFVRGENDSFSKMSNDGQSWQGRVMSNGGEDKKH